MNIFELCPKGYTNGENCKKLICHYKDTSGHCSLIKATEDREYSIEEIATILQISRHRVWRIYNNVLDKLRNGVYKDRLKETKK